MELVNLIDKLHLHESITFSHEPDLAAVKVSVEKNVGWNRRRADWCIPAIELVSLPKDMLEHHLSNVVDDLLTKLRIEAFKVP